MAGSNEFIFKKNSDGILEFVGDFNGYYINDDDPWGQSGEDQRLKEYYQRSRNRTLQFLSTDMLAKTLVVGCGSGHTMDFYQRGTPGHFSGIDISSQAISIAQNKFPLFDFHVANILDETSLSGLPCETFDTIIFEQILWYLLEDLGGALKNAGRLLKKDGELIISNGFERDQRYGNEIIEGYAGAVKYFSTSEFCKLKQASYFDDDLHLTDGHFVLSLNS